MKTKNNVQKAENKKFENSISKTFAVVLSLVLISFTVSANGFWKQILVNNTFGKMAIMMVDQANENKTHLAIGTATSGNSNSEVINASNYFSFETASDKNLEIESWMTNENNFSSGLEFDRIASDKPLQIENWMIENPNFRLSSNSNESEPALKVEAWMTNESTWAN